MLDGQIDITVIARTTLAYSALNGKVVTVKVSVLFHVVGLDVRKSLLVQMNSQDTTEPILVSYYIYFPLSCFWTYCAVVAVLHNHNCLYFLAFVLSAYFSKVAPVATSAK